MSNQEYIEKIKAIQEILLKYIEDEKDIDINFSNLTKIVQSDNPDFKLFFYLLSKIINNYHRNATFFQKIERILQYYQNDIKNFCSNWEIFNIFKSNKKILLFLIKSNLIKIDKSILKKITNNKYLAAKYPQYFYPEIKQNQENFDQKKFFIKNQENFEENRNNGENDSDVCKLIRNDSIEEFIIYVNKTNLKLNSYIGQSIFETNPFLIEKGTTTLIEYAAFFGSIQIFKYLIINKVPLTSSLWLYAIHGNNSEIIHILEDKNIDPPASAEDDQDDEEENEDEEEQEKVEKENKLYKDCIVESIKCHHNDIAKYLISNHYPSNEHKFNSLFLKYYNFEFISDELINESLFYELCQYGYLPFVKFLLNEKKIDINQAHKRDKIVRENIQVDRYIDDEIFTKPRIISVIRRKLRRDTPLYISIKKQHFDVAKFLLSKEDIDVNILNQGLTVEVPANKKLYPNEINTIRTAFTTAVDVGNIDIIKDLLSKDNLNANVRSTFNDLHKWGPGPEQGQYITEKPPLFIAYENEDMEIYKLLLSNEKINLNLTDKFTQMNPHGIFENFTVYEVSLLNMFVEKEDIENIKLLLQNERINANEPNKVITYSQYTQIFRGKQTVGKSETPKFALQIAAEKENVEIVKLLLNNKNIDTDIEDENGFELSESVKNPQIKQLLKDALSKEQEKQKFVIEPICTFEASGESMIDQKFFLCKTCGVNQDGQMVEGFCEVCARKCHKGHDIYSPSQGLVPSFCDCPGSGKCNCNKHEDHLKCTGEITNGTPTNQPMYQCKDCKILGDSYICQSCAINHHHGHKLIYKYKVKNAVCCNYHPA